MCEMEKHRHSPSKGAKLDSSDLSPRHPSQKDQDIIMILLRSRSTPFILMLGTMFVHCLSSYAGATDSNALALIFWYTSTVVYTAAMLYKGILS
ncbi:hypothetical protein RB213_003338 [Colletotrichum asianum]